MKLAISHVIDFSRRRGQALFRAIFSVPGLPKIVRDSADAAIVRSHAERQLLEVSEFFDAKFYLDRYTDVAKAKIDPLDHYVNHGWREGRRPSEAFDPSWYHNEYPDVIELNVNPVIHYLTVGKSEGRKPRLDPRFFDIARQMKREVAEIEPSILLDSRLADLDSLPINYSMKKNPLIRAWDALFDSLAGPYRYLIFVPWLTRGGADLAATNALKAIVEKYGIDSVLFVVTDFDKVDAAHWLPPDAHVRILSRYGRDLTRVERGHLVEFLIRALLPKAVLNVNSGACWDAMAEKGASLSRATELHACLFCRDYTVEGIVGGYSDTHLIKALPYLSRVYFDNSTFSRQLTEDFGIPGTLSKKFIVQRQPVSEISKGRKENSMEGGSIIWAGRFCRQKNVDLLIAIAMKMPHLQFDVYGYGDKIFTEKLEKAAAELKNLKLKGRFSATGDLPLGNYAALLYTSLWDGIPTLLIDAAALGIPIVASAVGGIPELVTDKTGWIIADYKNPEEYVSSLKEICSFPAEANARSEQMLSYVNELHSWSGYVSAFVQGKFFAEN